MPAVEWSIPPSPARRHGDELIPGGEQGTIVVVPTEALPGTDRALTITFGRADPVSAAVIVPVKVAVCVAGRPPASVFRRMLPINEPQPLALS